MKWHAEYAWLPGGLARDVRLEVVDGRFASVTAGVDAADASRLPGVVLPGFANAHSHAFHRALRGRTHAGLGSFWTWRESMYALADRLTPESYLRLATAVYAEMAAAGVTTVGEFHYLHHQHGGRPYGDPNIMAEALREAAAVAGVRLTLIDACYLHGGLTVDGYRPLDGVQQRFGDDGVDAWAARIELLRPSNAMRIGVAAHSVRAVAPEELRTVAAAAAGRPLHVHLSEQPAENADVLAFHGCTPTELMARAGFWSGASTAVHATHLCAADVAALAGAQATVCLCPTTERDLADGIGPARALHDAGVALSLGSDQNAVIDMFEEARAMEMHERLASNERGRFSLDEIMTALVQHRSLGWDDTGRIEPGARADLVAVRLDTARTAGSEPSQVVFAAGAADVDTVIVDGRVVVADGTHVIGDVGQLLQVAISELSEDR